MDKAEAQKLIKSVDELTKAVKDYTTELKQKNKQDRTLNDTIVKLTEKIARISQNTEQ